MTDWQALDRRPSDPGAENRVRLGFERQSVTLRIDQIVPLKTLREGVRESRKYAQIVSSIKAIGLVEAPAVVPKAMTRVRRLMIVSAAMRPKRIHCS